MRAPGKPATAEDLINPDHLCAQYFDTRPDPAVAAQLVTFGTSGHRGTAGAGTFNEAHILAITQAICDLRREWKIDGPLMLGKDTHALSSVAERTALEVLAENGVETILQENDGFTPTPAISRAILVHNRARSSGLADGIVITPSHNPPEDGGFKYNPPNGGPAEKSITGAIQNRANELLKSGAGILRTTFERARAATTTHTIDFATDYIADLPSVVNMAGIGSSGARFAADALGGASLAYWARIAEKYGLHLETRNTAPDPRFSFMTLDHDLRIRMDCSSPHAMAGLVELRGKYSVAWGCDPDADRHGIVTPAGLMNPNHYLAAAIDYLLESRGWNATVGKTMVSSSMIDRVVAARQRQLLEVPVGFKFFADGLFTGSLCFGGEESAGASFLRRDGSAWSTDKDGLILCLLAAEMLAETGKDPAQRYAALESDFGPVFYQRIDRPAQPAGKDRLKRLRREDVTLTSLAGDSDIRIDVTSPAGDPLDGVKVSTSGGWFAARPSGTENIVKLYAESFRSPRHLTLIQTEAEAFLGSLLGIDQNCAILL